MRKLLLFVALIVALSTPAPSAHAASATGNIALGSPGAGAVLSFSTGSDPTVPKTISYTGGASNESFNVEATLDGANYITVARLVGTNSKTTLLGHWGAIRTNGALGLSGNASYSGAVSYSLTQVQSIAIIAGSSASVDATLGSTGFGGVTVLVYGGSASCVVTIDASDTNAAGQWTPVVRLSGVQAWSYLPGAANRYYRVTTLSGSTCGTAEIVTSRPGSPTSPTFSAPQDFVASGLTVANTSTTINATGSFFNAQVSLGDQVSLSSSGFVTWARVLTISSDTTLQIDAALGDGTVQTIKVRTSVAKYLDMDGKLAAVMDQRGFVANTYAGIYGTRIGTSRNIVANKPLAPVDCAGAPIAATVAQVLDAGIFTCATAQTLTLPTMQGAAGIIKNLPGPVAVGDIFGFHLAEVGAFNLTLAAGAGATLAGPAVLAGPGSRDYLCRVTAITPAVETATCY